MQQLYLSKLTPYKHRSHLQSITHQLIQKGFPFHQGNPRLEFGILYRIQADGSAVVQSHVEPDWKNSVPASHWQTKEYKIPELTEGQKLKFFLTFNSVCQDGKTSRRYLVDPEAWLSRRFFGAILELEHIEYQPIREYSGRNIIPIHKHFVGGYCTVVDSDLLTQAIVNGVGRAKAYGCGLLSVQRIREQKK